MSTINLMNTQNNYFSTSSPWQAFLIEGADTKDYLQRMTTVDLNRLSDGSFSDGTMLNASGKLVLFFKLCRVNSSRYLLVAPADQTGTFEELEKFHFMEKFTITPLPATQSIRIWGNGKLANIGGNSIPEKNKFIEKNDTFLLGIQKFKDFSFDLLWMGSEGKIQNVLSELKGFKKIEKYDSIRIFSGEPSFPQELNLKTNPLEAEMDEAVHENKGCYPGQEVIERIRTMGQVPRKLILVTGEGAHPTFPQAISMSTDPNQAAGELTSAAEHPFENGKWVGLGFLKKIYWEHQSFLVSGNKVKHQFINPPESETT